MNDYRDNPDGTYSKKCPKCGSWAEAEFIYNGIGLQRISPYGCDECHWTEPSTYSEFLSTIEDHKLG